MIVPALFVYFVERARSFAAWPLQFIRAGKASAWLPGLASALLPLFAVLAVVCLAVQCGGGN